MTCGTALEARRNSDERWTFTPSSRNYTFSGMSPLFTVRRGDVVLLQIDQTETVNGSLFSVVGDGVVLQLKKGDAAILDGPSPDTDAEALFYDVTLTDQTGFENWIIGGPFTLLGLNDVSCGGCNAQVEVSLGGQCIQINIEGGNLGIGASVNLSALNTAVEQAQQAEEAAEQAAQQAEAARDDTISGLASKASRDASNITSSSDWRTALELGGSSTLNVGTTAGTVAAGDDARFADIAGKADDDGGNILPTSFRNALDLGVGDTPEFVSVALGTSPWTGGLSDRTISQILRDAVMPSILEFGGIGDGVADDTAAMNTALAAGRGVFLPKYLPSGAEAVWYFASPIQLPINAAIAGDFRLSRVKGGTGDVFRLAGGGRISIENLYIDCAAQTAGGVAIKFLTGTSSFAYTKIENVDIGQAYGSVHDQNGAGEIIYSRIRYVRALEPRGTPFKFSDFVAYNFLDHCFVDLVPLAGNPSFVSFDINGGAGLVMDTCEVNGFGQGATPNANQHAYLIQNQQALWMKNCFGDTTGGWGLRLISCAAALQDCTFGYNMEGQLYAEACPDLTITGRLWAQGRKGLTTATASKSAVVIKNSARVQMTAGVIRQGTGAGLELEAVSNSSFTLTANDNSSHGVYVNGCSSLNIAVESLSNGGAGVRVNNSTSIEVSGHYLSNAAYGIEETGTSNFNRYTGGFNANGTANGILLGARSRAFNYHNAAGAFVQITPAANADVVGSAVF